MNSALQVRRNDISFEHAYYRPRDLHRAGGDYVSTYRRSDGSLTVVMGDLWAKGMRGIFHAHYMRRVFRHAAAHTSSPAQIVSWLNEAFVEDLEHYDLWEGSGTAFVATFQPNGQLTYAAAGVEPAVIFRSAAQHGHLPPTGPLTGLDRNARYGERSLDFRCGEVLVAFTDGITEARAIGQGARPLGTHGLVEIVRRVLARQAILTCNSVRRELEIWTGGLFYDDATLAIALPIEGLL